MSARNRTVCMILVLIMLVVTLIPGIPTEVLLGAAVVMMAVVAFLFAFRGERKPPIPPRSAG